MKRLHRFVMFAAMAVVVCSSAFPGSAIACDRINITFFSEHFFTESELNEDNPGIFLGCGQILVGTFINSESGRSYSAIVTHHGNANGLLGYGIGYGIASGYEYMPLIPVVIGFVSIRVTSQASITATISPSPLMKNYGDDELIVAAIFGLEIEF